MNKSSFSITRTVPLPAGVIATLLLLLPLPAYTQLTGVENGNWRYLGGDAGHTRASPQLNQITAGNFSELEVAWIWRKHQAPSTGNMCYGYRSHTPYPCHFF